MHDALERVGVPCVIVTLGDRGSCVRTPEGLFTQAAFPVNAVDTTAAGDTFCGAFVAALSEGAALPEAVRVASAAAAIACTRLGAQPSIPTRDDVLAFLRSAG
jgi:ribokinase